MTDEPIVADWQARIREAAAAAIPLHIRGGGTKDFYGEAPLGERLDTTDYAGIVDYDPTELVITVRAGTPLDHLERAMAEHGQVLAFEPPHFGAGATIGGTVASGLSGPRRPYAGAVRDFVLGVRILDGKGEDLTFGGRVMKNVAGFDVSRLMAGALGTLGVLLDLSLKCLPLPRVERTLAFELGTADAIARMNAWSATPMPISATCHHGDRLWVRLSGAQPAVVAAAQTLGGEDVADAVSFWRSVRDQTAPFFASAPTLWRMSVRSTAPVVDFTGGALIEWGGALRWVAGDASVDPIKLRRVAAEQGGHATLFRAVDKSPGVFTPLPDALLAIHRRIKATFDPVGILNRGRLYRTL
ncbi:MAG: glycolate oxidase subunit GlcE [Casimicrobiaceae bacterium]